MKEKYLHIERLFILLKRFFGSMVTKGEKFVSVYCREFINCKKAVICHGCYFHLTVLVLHAKEVVATKR